MEIINTHGQHPEWELHLLGRDVQFGITVNMKIPNAFQRYMHKIFFGFEWRKK